MEENQPNNNNNKSQTQKIPNIQIPSRPSSPSVQNSFPDKPLLPSPVPSLKFLKTQKDFSSLSSSPSSVPQASCRSSSSSAISLIINHILNKIYRHVDLQQMVNLAVVKGCFNLISEGSAMDMIIQGRNVLIENENGKTQMKADIEPVAVRSKDCTGHARVKAKEIDGNKSKGKINAIAILAKCKLKTRKSKISFYKQPIPNQSCKLPSILQKSNLAQCAVSPKRNSSMIKTQPSQHSQMVTLSRLASCSPSGQADDHLINYLRFVKLENSRIQSNNSTQREQIINKFQKKYKEGKKHNQTEKNSSKRSSLTNLGQFPFNSKQKQRQKFASKKSIGLGIGYSQLDDCINQQQVKLIKNNFNDGNQALNNTKKKIVMTYQTCISVNDRQQTQNNFYSCDAELYKTQTQKLKQKSGLKSPKQKNKIQLPTSSQFPPLQSIKFPSLATSVALKKSASALLDAHEVENQSQQLSIWKKDKQKYKQFDNKMNQFVNNFGNCHIKLGKPITNQQQNKQNKVQKTNRNRNTINEQRQPERHQQLKKSGKPKKSEQMNRKQSQHLALHEIFKNKKTKQQSSKMKVLKKQRKSLEQLGYPNQNIINSKQVQNQNYK